MRSPGQVYHSVKICFGAGAAATMALGSDNLAEPNQISIALLVFQNAVSIHKTSISVAFGCLLDAVWGCDVSNTRHQYVLSIFSGCGCLCVGRWRGLLSYRKAVRSVGPLFPQLQKLRF